ncbi:putative transposase [Vibrio phage 1.170.O._10N.261.52.C3]|nr:putative transposase [Vibrio phage 1.170.O._10N.261.52.C3]
MISKSYKVRLYPNKQQEVLLRKTFGCVRKVWNVLLDENIRGYEAAKETNGKHSVVYNTTSLKKDYDFLKEVSAAALQQKGRDLKETYSQFFKGVSGKRKASIGYPKFKSKHNKQSFRLPVGKFTLLQEEKKIRLEKIGRVRCRYPATIPTECKLVSVTVSLTTSGEFYASVVTQQEPTLLPLTGKKVGIDLGIKELMTLSSGHSVMNPRFLRESQSKIARIQRHLSRKTKGSNRYARCKQKLAKVHRDVARQREWYLHNVTKALVKEFDLISIETLSSEGMKSKHKKVNSSLYDTSLYELTRQLEYKCHHYGKTLVKIDKWWPSSQLCCECGRQNKEIKSLSIRSWQCSCGATHHRDYNASVNILKKGLEDLSVESTDYIRGEFLCSFDYVKEVDEFIEAYNLL